MSKLISVLMPVYNCRQYVAEAIRSILQQTYRDFEFIIIDDGSTDGSGHILRVFAVSDSRIRLISRPNRGLVPSLNEGLSLSRGEFIARMDADDISFPTRLERQLAFMSSHPTVVATGTQHELIDDRSRLLGAARQHPLYHEDAVEWILTGRCPLNHPSVMMRRTAVLSVGGYRDHPAEDLDLWIRLSECGQIRNVPDTLMRYRLRYDSLARQYTRNDLDAIRQLISDACRKRGVAPPVSPTPQPMTHAEFHRLCATHAVDARQLSAARWHIICALLREPLERKNLHLAAHAFLPRPVVCHLKRLLRRQTLSDSKSP